MGNLNLLFTRPNRSTPLRLYVDRPRESRMPCVSWSLSLNWLFFLRLFVRRFLWLSLFLTLSRLSCLSAFRFLCRFISVLVCLWSRPSEDWIFLALPSWFTLVLKRSLLSDDVRAWLCFFLHVLECLSLSIPACLVLRLSLLLSKSLSASLCLQISTFVSLLCRCISLLCLCMLTPRFWGKFPLRVIFWSYNRIVYNFCFCYSPMCVRD